MLHVLPYLSSEKIINRLKNVSCFLTYTANAKIPNSLSKKTYPSMGSNYMFWKYPPCSICEHHRLYLWLLHLKVSNLVLTQRDQKGRQGNLCMTLDMYTKHLKSIVLIYLSGWAQHAPHWCHMCDKHTTYRMLQIEIALQQHFLFSYTLQNYLEFYTN